MNVKLRYAGVTNQKTEARTAMSTDARANDVPPTRELSPPAISRCGGKPAKGDGQRAIASNARCPPL